MAAQRSQVSGLSLMPARSPSAKILNALGIVAISVSALVAWTIWNFDRPPFDLGRLNQLQAGMTKAEVARKLGKPASDYGDHWAYSRFMAWPIVYVYFDDQDRLVQQQYDR
jgi:hypothetical protein